MANEQLLTAADGNADVQITVSLQGQSFGDGGDRVPPGRYKLQIEEAHWEAKKGEGKIGKNLKLTYHVAGPDGEHVGARIVQYMPAPTGDPTSEDFAKALKQVRNLLASLMSGRGQLEEARASSAGITFAPSLLKDQLVFAYLVDDEYNDIVRSKVQFFIPMEDYTKQPGPDPLAEAKRKASKPAPHVAATMTGTGTAPSPNLMAAAATPAATASLGVVAHAPSNGSDPAARMLGI